MQRGSFPLYDGFLDDIECIPIDTYGGWKKILCESLGSIYSQPPRVLNFILDLASDRLGAKTVVIERYISPDWADEYQAWYSRSFRSHSHFVPRLHFFKGIGSGDAFLTSNDLLNLPTECTRNEDSAYVGYCILRPFEPITVGDTVLQSPHVKGDSNAVHCLPHFQVNLLGHTLTVRGMPFMQQDRAVSVCAEADLWMIAKYMHAEGRSRRFRPSEMVKFATGSFNQAPLRDGLLVEQIHHALALMDLNPEGITPLSAAEALRIIYSYVESQIPVMVAIPGHVFTVVGHTYSSEPNGIISPIDSLAAYVDSFVVHDDELGPYLELKVGIVKEEEKGDAEDKQDQFTQLCLTEDADASQEEKKGAVVDYCLIPKPSSVIHLLETDVRLIVPSLLSKQRIIRFFGSQVPEDFWEESDFSNLVTRIYLRSNEQFKREILPPNEDIQGRKKALRLRDPRVIATYWRQMLPEYIWVVELADKSDLDTTGPSERKIVGEMILDSTAHRYAIPNTLLALHLKGRMIYRENPPGELRKNDLLRDRREFQLIKDLDTTPYDPLNRKFYP
jgi:hypothetical protein